MTLDLDLLLPLYALGLLEGEERESLERAVASEPYLQRELAAYRDGAHGLAGALSPIAPPAHLPARLLAATGGGPLDGFAARFAAMFDLAVERGRELLGWIHDPGKWHPATPGVSLIHFRGGPAHAGADCGVIRIVPGTSFPWHAHQGEELTLFLAGTARDHDGVLYQPGDTLVQAPGTAHEFTSIGDTDMLFAVRYRGVDFAAKKPT